MSNSSYPSGTKAQTSYPIALELDPNIAVELDEPSYPYGNISTADLVANVPARVNGFTLTAVEDYDGFWAVCDGIENLGPYATRAAALCAGEAFLSASAPLDDGDALDAIADILGEGAADADTVESVGDVVERTGRAV